MGITFKYISEKFEEIEGTSSRNDMSNILAKLFSEISTQERQVLSYMVQGRVAPEFVSSEFNLSKKSILKLLGNILASKVTEFDLEDRRVKLGDIGEVAKEVSLAIGFKSVELSLLEIYDRLWEVIKCGGNGSAQKKANIVGELFSKMSPVEGKYLSRIICGELRLGVNAKSVLDSFSMISKGDKSKREWLDRAYGIHPDLGYISSLMDSKEGELLSITPGVPILARLVERVGSFEEISERFEGEFLVQPKYDGLRCQIHKYTKGKAGKRESVWEKYIESKDGGGLFEVGESSQEVKLFTRNLEDVTEMFPEIVQAAKDMQIESFVMDSEVLGWNYSENKFLTYQETMQRRRKYGVDEKTKDIPVKAMVFDILYCEGKDISETNTSERLDILKKVVSDTDGGIELSPTDTVGSIEELRKIFDESVTKGLEGVIVKKKEGKYLPGTRNYEWIKLKKSMEKGLVDTIDLVAIGFYHGSGRRGALGVGAVLGAIYNSDSDMHEGVCKVGTGFSDELLLNISKSTEEDILLKKPKNVVVPETLIPDVWIDPKIVFSVESDEITRNLKANKDIAGGLSLRFPRLVEWGRDKGVTEATSLEELLELFTLQERKK